MTHLRFEAWTRPESGTLARKFPIRGVVAGEIALAGLGRGRLVLPASHSRLDEILFVDPADHSNDQASIIRGYLGEDLFGEFYAKQMEIHHTDLGERVAVITGGGPKTALERVRVRQFDYPESPSKQPDWEYGTVSLLEGDTGIDGFEQRPEQIVNPGAEDGSTIGWGTTGTVAGGQPDGFEAVNDAGLADDGDWFFRVVADTGEGVTTEFPAREGFEYTVHVRVKAASGKQVRLEATNAASFVTSTPSGGGLFNGSAYATVTGDGTWKDLIVTFDAGAGDTPPGVGDGPPAMGSCGVSIYSLDDSHTFDFDTVRINGWGIGVGEWQASGDVNEFEAVDSGVATPRTGSYSLAWHPNSGVAGNDRVWLSVPTTPGTDVTARVWVRHTEGADRDLRLVLRIPGVDPNSTNVASVAAAVPTGVWTEIVATGTAISVLTELEVRFDETGAPASFLQVDDVEFFTGMPAAAVGEIWNDLLDDAAVDHAAANRTALAWLTRTFTDSLDSASQPWGDELAVRIKRGQQYLHVDDRFADYGYESRIRTNPADETEWLFDVYNPGGMGTDYSAGDSNAILSRPGLVDVAPIVRREPAASYAMVEGDDFLWAEHRDVTLETVWGELETYDGSLDHLNTSLSALAEEIVDTDYTESLVLKLVNPPNLPGVAYLIGDLVRASLAETVLPSTVYRVVDITCSSEEPEAVFQVELAIPGS